MVKNILIKSDKFLIYCNWKDYIDVDNITKSIINIKPQNEYNFVPYILTSDKQYSGYELQDHPLISNK